MTVADLPAGYTVQSIAPSKNAGLVTREPECSEFLSASDFIDNAQAASAQVAVLMVQPDPAGDGWRGVETLRTYPGDGAHAVMEAIRRYAAKCPSVTVPSSVPGDGATKYALAPGIGTGDESLSVTARTARASGSFVEETDMTVIRRGNVLITLDDNVPLVSPPTGITDQLMAMAKAADAKAAKA